MQISLLKNLNELLLIKINQNLSKDHLFFNNENIKKFQKYSWQDTKNHISKIANFLKNKNLKKGERVLLVSENRPEWLISDYAIMLNGGITVPNYTTYSINDYVFTINDCKPKGVIVSNTVLLKKILAAIEKINYKFDFIIFLNKEKDSFNNYTNYESIINSCEKEEPIEKINFNNNIIRSDPACIIYTSGTQGNPKGVVLSHGGILKNCEGSLDFLKFLENKQNTFLTWLPLSHAYEHTVQFVQIVISAKIYYSESLEKLFTNFKIAKPTIMTAVPRFYINIVNKIKISVANQNKFNKKIFEKTLNIGKKIFLGERISLYEKIINFFLEAVVRNKIKKQFGGKILAFISGGGPLDYNVGVFMNSIGLKTLQGYGLTECSPIVSCNPINKIKLETVGKIFKDIEVKISNDGEILVKGENLMLGYWNNKEDTNKVLKDNWLSTGDIGEIDQEGYLKITDRKKDIIVNSGGDNISPSKIENLLNNYPEILQSYIYGDNKNYLVALIVVEKNTNNVKNKIQNIIDTINKNLMISERIKKFEIIDKVFSVDNGMLTPTMKIRRHQIKKIYGNKLEQLYL